MSRQHQSFHFNFYGLQVNCKSSLPYFVELLKRKFLGWQTYPTAKIADRQINLSINPTSFSPSQKLTKLSSTVSYDVEHLLVKHQYLSSQTEIVYRFDQQKLSQIELYLVTTWQFNLLNFLLANLLLQQLIQTLIAKYVEQVLLLEISRASKLSVLHAAAVEKDGQVIILTGLNGVGKSTLAQQLIKQHQFNLFADNYLLCDSKQAFFSPDLVRLDKQSLAIVDVPTGRFFGFNKFQLAEDQLVRSKLKHSQIKRIYIIQRAHQWRLEKLSLKRAKQIIDQLQRQHGEEVSLAVTAQYYLMNNFLLDNSSFPEAQCFLLSIADPAEFDLKDLL